MKWRIGIGMFALCLLAGVQTAWAGNVFISGGKAHGAIVLEKNPSKSAQRAAKELSHYLYLQTGVKLKIGYEATGGNDIFLGYTDHARKAGLDLKGLEFDGFKIVTKDGDLYIFGDDYKGPWPIYAKGSWYDIIHIYNKKLDLGAYGNNGTFHGVMYLLKKYRNCRWFMPGELGEYIPVMRDFTLQDIDYKRNPAFEYRYLNFGLWNHEPEVSKWNARAGFGARYPIRFEHSFYRFDYLRKTNPEYMALQKDGTRCTMPDGNRGSLCLTAKGLDQVVANAAIEFFKANPSQIIYPVMPNDNTNTCQCENCKAQVDLSLPKPSQASNYVWGFINRVARILAKTYPDKMIGCCAYSNYVTPPTNMKMEPNVAIMVTTCLPWIFDELYRWRNEEMIYKWCKITSNIYTWDYYCWDDTNQHLTGLPILISHWLADDLKKRNGHSKGMYLDCRLSPINGRYLMAYPEFNHLNIYLAGELQWDPEIPVDDLLNDYYTKFYGPAAAEMKQFWSYAEEIWCNKAVKKRGPKDNLQKDLYTPQVLAKLKSYLEAAQSKVKWNTRESRRIKKIQDHFYSYYDRVAGTRSKRPTHVVRKINPADAPKIDGVRDTVWRRANGMSFVDNFSSRDPEYPTNVRTLHDGTNLYIFVTAHEGNMAKLRSPERKRDNTARPHFWDDDAMEFFILPDISNPQEFFQIVINAKGNSLVDLKANAANPEDYSWNTSIRYKAGVTKSGWTLELAIPLKDLNFSKYPGINIGRDRQAGGVTIRTAWAPSFGQGWAMSPHRAGNLVFEK